MKQNNMLAMILAGGRGSRLHDLTQKVAKPAVSYGGKYRIIDFPLSNCANSGIDVVGVLTQYESILLNSYVAAGRRWGLDAKDSGVYVLPPREKSDANLDVYRGTADAISQNIDFIDTYSPEYLLILSGDHIYKMNYARMLAFHKESKADATIAVIEVPMKEASRFGIMNTDETGRIVEFEEKPEHPKSNLASMGIYIFNWKLLRKLLLADIKNPDSNHDFGKDIIPKITEAGMAYAHPFPLSCVQSDPNAEPYWRDVGTLEAYWKANLDLASVTPELDMYDQNWPIRTHMESLPPAKFVQDRSGSHGMTLNSLVSGGCIISGSVVVQSVLFPRVRVNSFCNIDSAVLLPDVWVGRSCRLRRCVIDRACVIPEGMVIGENAEEDARRFYRSEEGIVLVTRDMLRKLGHKQER